MNKFIIFGIYYLYLPIIIINCYKSYSSIPCNGGGAEITRRSPRIVGGIDTIKGEIPFIVSLTRRGGHFCGASILNEKWLITAAHCICNGLNKIIKPTHIKGIIGLHQFSEFKRTTSNNNYDGYDDDDDKRTGANRILYDNTNDNKPFEVSFKNIIKHPSYDCTKTNDDIALLELTKSLNFNDYVKPVCIPVSDNNNNNGKNRFDNTLATVSGWGWTNEIHENGIRPDILQKASVKVWNNEKCQDSYQMNGKNMIISRTQMCAGYKNGKIDSCWADSGGPLIIENNILIGIVSTGIGCARAGLPGIYTRVNEYSQWIESIVLESS